MRTTKFIWPILCFAFLGHARGSDVRPESALVISEWPHNAPAAFSLTFDDCFGSQYTLAAPMLSEVGVKATFFVITKYLDSRLYGVGWSEFKALSDSGHEIGSHSEYHPDFSKVDSATAYAELKNSRITIEKKIGKRCLFFAWPYGKSRALTSQMASQIYLGARGVGETVESGSPADPYSVRASGMPETFAPLMDSILKTNGWFIRVVHKVGDSINEIPVPELKRELEVIKAKNFWIAPFGEAFLYGKARDSAKMGYELSSDSVVTVSLKHSLPDSIYNAPLTVGVRLPLSWGGAVCKQSDSMPWQHFEIRDGYPWVWSDMRANAEPLKISRMAIRSDTAGPIFNLTEPRDSLICGKPVIFTLNETAEAFLVPKNAPASSASRVSIRSGEIADCKEPSDLYAIDEAGNLSLPVPVAGPGLKNLRILPDHHSRNQRRARASLWMPVVDGLHDILGRWLK